MPSSPHSENGGLSSPIIPIIVRQVDFLEGSEFVVLGKFTDPFFVKTMSDIVVSLICNDALFSV